MPAEGDDTLSIAVETSGRVGSVAVARGGVVLARGSFSTGLRHGVELLPAAEQLCKRAGVEPGRVQHVYVSGGPGSFTGLRIGITFAKAMALAAGAKVVRVPTLHAIAQNALALKPRPERVVVILDAKREHAYSAAFALSGDAYVPLDEPAERDPMEYLPSLGPIAAVGEGIECHKRAIELAANVEVPSGDLNEARAETVLMLGRRMAAQNQFIDINDLVPIYIRRPEAVEKWEERHGTAPS